MQRRWIGLAALFFMACQPRADEAPEAARAELTDGEEPATDPLAGLDARSRRALANAPVAALLLPEGWNERSTVTSGRGFYAVSARDGEISVYLHATDVVHHGGDGREAPAPEHEVRGVPARILVNEGIRSVTWERGGTSYVLEVECFRPFEDERCTEDAFLCDLAERLVEVPR